MYHGMSIDNIFERFISYPDFMDGTYKRANMVKFIDTYKKTIQRSCFSTKLALLGFFATFFPVNVHERK